MKGRKTIHLGEMFRINNGAVEFFGYSGEWDEEISGPKYDWMPTKYRVGARVMLVSYTDVSPNAIREGRSIDKYSLLFDCPDGIPGNLNHDITRYHGWRGTTDDVSCYAHGLREIVNIRELKNGRVAVTVGPDLTPEED